MGLLDYYRQFDDMEESEVNQRLRERRAQERALALERVPPLDLSSTEWPDLPDPEVVGASVYQARGRLNGYPDPDATRVFFTDALVDPNRVGNLASVANQSLRGAVGRINEFWFHPKLWVLAVLLTLAFWAWRVWRAARVGDEVLGFALTAVVGCLVSPVTWVHHLVWLIPALLLLVDRGFAAGGWRGRADQGCRVIRSVFRSVKHFPDYSVRRQREDERRPVLRL